MSAVHLLKQLAFCKASCFEVVSSLELKKKDPVATTPKPTKSEYSKFISFTFKFSHPVIIQRLELEGPSTSKCSFTLVQVEGNLLGDLIDYEPFLGTQLKENKLSSHGPLVQLYDARGVGEMVRLTFGFNPPTSLTEEVTKELVYQAFIAEIETASFFGISSSSNIKPFLSKELLNLSLFFRKENLYLSANEVEIVLALAMMNDGKVGQYNQIIQAREILTKCINFQEYCTNGIIEHLMRLKNYDFSFTSVQKILHQITKIRYRSALLELLKSTLFRGETLFDDRVKSMVSACSLYCKSKKKDKLADAGTGDHGSCSRVVFSQLYATLITMLGEILSTDTPDYFQLAALDTLTFSLRYQELLSKEEIMMSITTIFEFTRKLGTKEPFDWKFEKGKSRLVTVSSLKETIKQTDELDLVLGRVFNENVLEIPSTADPYLNTAPLLYAYIDNYLSCLNSMLPSLSAFILQKAFSIVVHDGSLFTFGTPAKILIVLEKIVEKTIVICQADVHIPTEFINTLIICLTVLNNQSYRQKVERMLFEGEEVQLSSKELLAMHLQTKAADCLEQLTSVYTALWETLKAKYIFLIGLNNLKRLMTHITSRLQELAQELESQVFTSEFDDFEFKSSRVTDQSTAFNELKFEKVKFHQDSPLLISTKDFTKSKLEYLKNFRDIFGELEYYLELIDCLSASIKEKFNNSKKEGISSHISDNQLDRVSKKLISNFTSSGLQLVNNMDSRFWDLWHELAGKILLFLKLFMKDAVFIDYFQSSWVILCNLLAAKTQQSDHQINVFLSTLLEVADRPAGGAVKLANPHTLKCIFYMLDHTTKTMQVGYEEKVNEQLVRIMSQLFVQVRHSQNSDLVRLLRFLMNKYPEVISEEAIPDLFTLFLDSQFDMLGENSVKLFDQFIDIACRRSDKDTILATLVQIILSWSSVASANLINSERRRQILAKRRKKQAADVSAKASKEQQVLDFSKRLSTLSKIFDKLNPKLIVEFSRISILPTEVQREDDIGDQEGEYNESSLLPFFTAILELSNTDLDLGIAKLLILFLQKVKPNSTYVTKSSATICRFVLHIVDRMSQQPFLSSECKHELLLGCLMVFSVHLPPANFDEEIESYEDYERFRGSTNDATKLSENSRKAATPLPTRNGEIVCLKSLREYLKAKGKVSFGDTNYTNTRIYEFMKLFMSIKGWIDSPWSAVKSLFCNLNSLDECLQAILKAELSSLLISLFGSKESESIINGLNIMGSLFGFGADLSRTSKLVIDNINFFKRNSSLIPIAVWEKVFSFQESWDITIQIASILILQLALPSDYAQYIYKKRKQRVKLNHDTSRSFEMQDLSKVNERLDNFDLPDKENASMLNHPLVPRQATRDSKKMSTEQGLDLLLRQVTNFKHKRTDQGGGKTSFSVIGLSMDHTSEDGSYLDINWLEKNFQEEEIRQLMNLFKMHFSLEENKWTPAKVPDRNPEIVSDGTEQIDTSTRPDFDKPAHTASEIHPTLKPILGNTPLEGQHLTVISNSMPTADHRVKQVETVKAGSRTNTANEAQSKNLEPSKTPTKIKISADSKYFNNARPSSPLEESASLEQRITFLQEKSRSTSPPTLILNSPPLDSQKMAENPVKKIIKMKNKLIDGHTLHDEAARDEGFLKRNTEPDDMSYRVPSISIEDIQGLPKPISKRSDLSSSSHKEREFQGNSRKSVTRKEINRILSSHFIKPPTDSLLKTISSPKNLACINEQIAELIKGKTSSGSKVRFSSKQRGKNSSVGSLRDKRDKNNNQQVAESVQERPSLPKKSSNLLTDLKKKMLSNLASSKKVALTADKQVKKHVLSIASKAPELQTKLTSGQHRATSTLLRYKPQD